MRLMVGAYLNVLLHRRATLAHIEGRVGRALPSTHVDSARQPIRHCVGDQVDAGRRRTSAASTRRSLPRMSSKRASRSSRWSSRACAFVVGPEHDARRVHTTPSEARKEKVMSQHEQQHTTAASGNLSRRGLLGAAALGAGGLALMQAAAAAEGSDRGNPGEGGYGRNAVQLPPGAKVASHDPKDR
jgi:hypothetical protein